MGFNLHCDVDLINYASVHSGVASLIPVLDRHPHEDVSWQCAPSQRKRNTVSLRLFHGLDHGDERALLRWRRG